MAKRFHYRGIVLGFAFVVTIAFAVTACNSDVPVVVSSLPNSVSDTGSGAVALTWGMPTEYTNGSPLVDLTGFKIYYGTASKTYTQTITVSNPTVTRYVVDNLPAGTYYFSVTTIAGNGLESSFSPEASKTIS